MSEQQCTSGQYIDAGQYGTIYYTQDRGSVIKILNESVSSAEVDILFRLRSPHLVKGLELYSKGQCGLDTGPGIRMELLAGRGLAVAKTQSFEIVRRLLYHYALGLKCLHDNNYYHLDIGISNAMYGGTSTNPIGKLIDFGLSSATQRDEKNGLYPIHTIQTRVTVTYRPFESLMDKRTYSDKTDIWSLGMIYLEMLGKTIPINYADPVYNTGVIDKALSTIVRDATGAVDYKDSKLVYKQAPVINYEATTMKQITQLTEAKSFESNLDRRLQTIPLIHRPSAIKLLMGMLSINVNTRFNINQVIADPFFAVENKAAPPNDLKLCSQVAVAPVLSDAKFDERRRTGLNFILSSLKSEWGKNGLTEFYFNALDVYMRVIACVGPHTTSNEFKQLAGCACIVAHKIYYTDAEIPLNFFGKAEYMKHEMSIFKALGGIIKRPYLYDAVENGRELIYMTRELFFSENYDALTDYLRIDVAAYSGIVRRRTANIVPHRSKRMLINNFLEAVNAPSDLNPDVGFNYMLKQLASTLSKESVEVFMEAVHLYIRAIQRIRVMPGLVKNTSNDTLTRVGIASIIAVLQLQQMPIPEIFSEEKMLDIYGIKKRVMTRLLEEKQLNPYYAAASTADELRSFYQYYLMDSINGRYTIFDEYSQMNPNQTMAEIRNNYDLREGSKDISIAKLFEVAAPLAKS
jgi:serine/threonine protein kinase